VQLQDPLPDLPVPLREPDPDVAVNLGAAVASVYERAGYGSLIDYHGPPPPPPLAEVDSTWLDGWPADKGLR
jgi:hypothetical protein